jgi:hypothetical protein
MRSKSHALHHTNSARDTDLVFEYTPGFLEQRQQHYVWDIAFEHSIMWDVSSSQRHHHNGSEQIRTVYVVFQLALSSSFSASSSAFLSGEAAGFPSLFACFAGEVTSVGIEESESEHASGR